MEQPIDPHAIDEQAPAAEAPAEHTPGISDNPGSVHDAQEVALGQEETPQDTAQDMPTAAALVAVAGGAPVAAGTLVDAADAAPPPETATVVPLTRLQGVQRVLAQAQKDLASMRAEAAALRASLNAAQQRAALEYADRLRATETNIVPQLISGDTMEQVDQSLANSKAAFSAAQQAYARTLPTPTPRGVGAAAPPDADHNLTPLQLLRAGLSQTMNDINR